MRSLVAFALFLGTASQALPQEGRAKTPDEIPPRFGVVFKGRVYSQATPKDALQSAIDAAEKVEFSYLVAHLLDPAFVDARIADRAKQAEPAVEANLAALRDFQLKNLDKIALESRLPVDAALSSLDGRPAIYGVRPEHFTLADDGVEAEIRVVEL